MSIDLNHVADQLAVHKGICNKLVTAVLLGNGDYKSLKDKKAYYPIGTAGKSVQILNDHDLKSGQFRIMCGDPEHDETIHS